VTFALRRAPGAGAGAADIHATYYNRTAQPITGFSLQAAVPKFMQLRLDPASGSTLAPGGAAPVTQVLHVTNSMHGQKALVMRLRLAYTQGGQGVTQQCEVSGFPSGF